MQRKDLALRVLSTAAIMSIVTSIAAPAFADIYYIGNGSIDVETKEDTDGKYVQVTQNGTTYTDRSNEIVIKDGTGEGDTTLTEAKRAEGTRANPAVAPAAGAATLELEAAGTAAAAGPAAGESQPDPDDAFTLSEEEEDSEEGKDPTESPTDNPTDDPTANTKKDVVYEYAPADPEPEQQATKLTLSAADAPAAETPEATLADAAPAAAPTTPTAPAAAPPAEGSAGNPSKNVIRVINNWAEKVLNIRLSNVNIKQDYNSTYADGTKEWRDSYNYGVSAAEVQGTGNTKIELDGKNVLDSTDCGGWAGLSKKGSGNLTITDETSDTGKTITTKEETEPSGSLRAESGKGAGAAIGGSYGQATENITIEGYATVNANTLGHDGAGIGGGSGAKGSNITIQGHANVTANGGASGAGIGGGSSNGSRGGDAENITIQGYSKVTAISQNGAGIGSGSSYGDGCNGSAKKIVICDHATVVAKNSGHTGTRNDGAAIGAAGYAGQGYDWYNNYSAEVIIGTPGATAATENVNIIATGLYGSAIGNGAKDTNVTIQGNVNIRTASSQNSIAIGSNYGNVDVNITDNASIDTATGAGASGIGGGYLNRSPGRTVKVNIDGGTNGKVKLGENSAIIGSDGAISGTEVKIGDNVLLKMKQSGGANNEYIKVKNNAGNEVEAAVGKRSDDPTASGLVNTIGDNTELWYTDYYNKLQKIVHSKNLCTKELVGETAATCTTPGSKTYKCTFESSKDAANPEHTETWVEPTNALGHDFTVKQSETPATCETAGTIVWKCSRCDETKTETIPALDHDWGDWQVTTPATCTTKGVETRYCNRDHNHFETRPTADVDSNNHGNYKTHIEGYVAPTCTKDGYTGNTRCNGCDAIIIPGKVIPALGHNWVDNGDGTHGCDNPGCTEKHPHNWVDKGNGTHTCPDCGATETLPVNTNSALELRVVDAEGMNQPFTVSQNGTLRTYTGAYDTATLTGDLNTLCYLQEHGAQTIQFVTNGQTSSFAINDLLAQGSGSEVFYLTHRGAEEPTLLLLEADHSELVKD